MRDNILAVAVALALCLAGCSKKDRSGSDSVSAPKSSEPQQPSGPESTPTHAETLSEKQKILVADAIKALGRIEAAVQVGVNYKQYSQLLIDAKAAMNDADRTLPSGELSTNLKDAMTAYQEAGAIWNHKIDFSRLGIDENPNLSRIVVKYSLRNRNPNIKEPNEKTGYGYDVASPDVALQIIWKAATAKLSKARGSP